MTLVLFADVIIFKISWQTCFDSQSHCCSSCYYSSSNFHCGSEMFCSLVHLILISGEMFLLMPGLKTLLRAPLNLYLTYSYIHDTSPTSSLTDTQSFATLKNVYHICLVSLAIILHLHHFPPHFAILTHVSQGGMLKEMNENWFVTGFTLVAQKCCEACLICISNNHGKACKVEALATHPPLDRPF